MSSSTKASCPKCGRKQPAQEGNDTLYYCPNCRAMFDNSPDEGGDYFSDPSKRLERQESRRTNTHQRRRYR